MSINMSKFNTGSMNKFKSCYNKCLKLFFGYKRSYSVTQMLSELELPSLETVLFNGAVTFKRMCITSVNKLNVSKCICNDHGYVRQHNGAF